jgi:hypothetical protein
MVECDVGQRAVAGLPGAKGELSLDLGVGQVFNEMPPRLRGRETKEDHLMTAPLP